MNQDIDVVITWVNGDDREWLRKRNSYATEQGLPALSEEEASVRYRSWDNLQYIFRGIEKFMPWVHRVYLVTDHQAPDWLNQEYPKLQCVDHTDFIPAEYLPTFNSNTIDLNLFRIPGLAEQFIYFNDDTFVIGPTQPTDFFVDGKPKDMACISPQPIYRDAIRNIEINNLKVLNDHFSISDIRKNKRKWIDFRDYGSFAVRTMIFMKFSTIIGIFETHQAASHLKSNCEEIWELETAELDQTCKHHFRSTDDVNQWLFRNWMLLSGRFVPRKKSFGAYMSTTQSDLLQQVIKQGKSRLACMNDGSSMECFEDDKKVINQILDNLLPDKSLFEK